MTPDVDVMFAPLANDDLKRTPPHSSAPKQEDDWHPLLPAPAPLPRSPRHPVDGHPSDGWTYRDRDGAVLFSVYRFDPPDRRKEFFPYTYGTLDRRDGWHWKAPLAPRPLYGLDRLAKRPDAPVVITEGEKKTVAAERLFPEFVAVTSPNGAESADKADWTALAGRKVTIWPDHDEEGAGYAGDVARLANKAGAANVTIVQVPEEFPHKWDLADAPPEGWTLERLCELLETAQPVTSIDTDHPQLSAIEAELARLAELSSIEYECIRKDAAKALNIRIAALDREVARRRGDAGDVEAQGRRLELPTPEPWREAVDGATLLNEIAATFSRYLALPKGAADAVALWVLHTHIFDVSLITPRLGITSPLMGCGKTTLLSVLAALVRRPLQAANVTPAAIFRTVEMAKPTLLIDEADSFLSHNDELRGILNSGHRRDGAVIRLVGDNYEPRQFATFAPAAIACIGKLPATLMDRSIEIEMRRRRPDEDIAELIDGRPEGADRLARQCTRWTNDHRIALASASPIMPLFLRNRSGDNWRPLLAIADVAGKDWAERARAAARLLLADKTGDDDSPAVMLLADLKVMFQADGTDRLTTKAILAALEQMANRPWPEWRHGKPITDRQLAKLLKPFKIESGTIRVGGETPKGYYLAAFADAFTRYLPADPPQRHNNDGTGISRGSASATFGALWRDENAVQATDDGRCGSVADRKEEIDSEEVEETLWTG